MYLLLIIFIIFFINNICIKITDILKLFKNLHIA